ncbi:MAG: methyl-accepting chemotaxis protein [Candidatus Eisenbacteria sp.]|nr:methyl-accepting chemotaxis protein [Candidatus Eisenbacteria bacterium]
MQVRSFKNWGLFSKLMSISIVAIVLIGSGIVFQVLPRAGERIRDQKRDATKNVVDIAFSLMNDYSERTKSGELTLEEAQRRAVKRIKELRYQEKEYFWINDLGPKMIMHPYKPELDGKDLTASKDPNGKHLFVEMADVCRSNGAGFVDYMWPKPGATKPVPKVSYVKLFKPWGWIVGSGVYLDDVQSQVAGLRLNAIVVLALCAVAALSMTLLIARKITAPLANGISFAEAVRQGDFTKTLAIDQDDEIGMLVKALNGTIASLGQMIRGVVSSVGILASSSTELSSIAEHMSAGSDDTTHRTNKVSTAVDEMSSNMRSVAAATEQAATGARTVATASEQMSATINEIAQSAERGRTMAAKAVSASASASDKVDELGRAAQEIGKVTEAITAISEQTNLLALNATIEAASAGDAGKGFAVVANEVKELARQTADATGEIEKRIQGIQKSTQGTVDKIKEISAVIDDVSEIVSTIAAAVEEQSTTTKEIASNIVQTSQGIQEISEMVGQTFNASEGITKDVSEATKVSTEMSASSSQVKQKAGELSKLSDQLNEMMAKFKVAS